jgi:phage shock protein B
MDNVPILGMMIGGLSIVVLFVLLPWLVLHYVTKWRATSRLTEEDETMLDELYDLARRLDERMATIERIMNDEHPDWNALSSERAALLSARSELAERRSALRDKGDLTTSGRL